MIQLYKIGTTHTVRGIECEVCNFAVNDMALKLSEGWVRDPSELITGASSEGDSQEVPEKKLNPVRQAAKDAGIDGWNIKRIKTLETELEK